MIKIYHNPRCRKSREGLAILEESGKDFQIIKYLDDIPSVNDIQSIIDKLEVSPIDLVRKQEKIWKENYKNKTLSDPEILKALHEHPKLIERPIVIKDNKAVIGRPPGDIKKIL
ncbi:arsenate reductase (glutaredoxin) [Psychroflexus salinarum]|uniref:Arsenate reductase (Glutaredoxin) n=1 Tax=Psychroflexus salinarum TaxID=546024 RepID=A0ABW3GRL3_9FLAO